MLTCQIGSDWTSFSMIQGRKKMCTVASYPKLILYSQRRTDSQETDSILYNRKPWKMRLTQKWEIKQTILEFGVRSLSFLTVWVSRKLNTPYLMVHSHPDQYIWFKSHLYKDPTCFSSRLAQRAEWSQRDLSALWASWRASPQAVTSKWQLRHT